MLFSTKCDAQITLRSMVRSEGEPHVLVEANIGEGVVSAPLSKSLHNQTRLLVDHKSGN
jgi:hypothetical protein